jgi:peptidoglycan/LPS O-acetylase OafA/YrhL
MLSVPNAQPSNNFDAMRLMLAASVILYHTAFLSRVPILAWAAGDHWGSIGIQGFFFISGFLIVMSYERSRDLRAYLVRRARRIAPAYVAVVLCAAVLLAAMSRLSTSAYFSDVRLFRYLEFNLALSNFSAPTLPGVFEDNFKHPVDGSLWTIKIEVMFYLFVPILCWLAARWRYRVVLPLLGLASIAWACGFEQAAIVLHRPFMEQLAVQLPGQLCYFVGGIVAYRRAQAGLAAPSAWHALLGLGLYAAFDGLAWQIVSPLAVYLMMSWACLRMPSLGSPTRHGDVSYGIYLVHWPVLQTGIALGLFNHCPLAAAAGCWCVIVALGYASWYVVERRFLLPASPRIAALSPSASIG